MSNVNPENKFTYYKGVYYFGHFRTHKFGGYWRVYDDTKYPQNFQFMCDKHLFEVPLYQGVKHEMS